MPTTPDRPADQLRDAAEKLRAARFSGAITATPIVAALIGARQPLARWLESWSGVDLSEHGPMPEDAQHALAVARQLLGTSTGEGAVTDENPRSIPTDLGLPPAEEIALLRRTLEAVEEGRSELRAENARLRAALIAKSAAPPAPADRAATGAEWSALLNQAADRMNPAWFTDEATAAAAKATMRRLADEAPVSAPLAARFEALAAEWEKRGEYGDSSITDRARELRAVLAGEAQPARRRLTPNEHDRAWHAIEGTAGKDGADPGTVLNAVLHALRIDAPTAAEEQAASPRRRLAGEAAAGAHHPRCGHCSHPADWHDEWEGCVGPNGVGGVSSGDCTCTRCPDQAAGAHQTEQADTVLAAAIPEWEAVYEPGNVSDYLIGYANSEAAAKGAAIAWVLSQTDKTADRLEWVTQNWNDRHDAWFDLIERHDDGVDTGVGVTVRHRLHPYTAADFAPEDDETPAVPAAPEETQ
ncbi:hypothetical protein [Streptomyces globisporus]|uniref:hypothetical protein n=1 Tax=Streptomyces globisporus TaxID=1908 RepID=UPI0037F825CF